MAFLKEFGVFQALLRILMAAVFGGLIGYERGRHGRAAGMRTHIFVCLGACMCTVIGLYVADILGHSNDPLRVGAQVVSGIGFLGAGTILIKGKSHITGLTTAAGLWATAAIGLAVGVGFYEAAILCTVICIVTATFLTHFEYDKRMKNHRCTLYVEVTDASRMNDVIRQLDEYGLFDAQIGPPKSEISGSVGLNMQFTFDVKEDMSRMIEKIVQIESVAFAYPSEF